MTSLNPHIGQNSQKLKIHIMQRNGTKPRHKNPRTKTAQENVAAQISMPSASIVSVLSVSNMIFCMLSCGSSLCFLRQPL